MNLEDLKIKMDSSIKHLEKEFQTIRTSRANPSMIENIFVDAYGSKTPLNQLGNISVLDASTITIQIWDSSLIKVIKFEFFFVNFFALLIFFLSMSQEYTCPLIKFA